MQRTVTLGAIQRRDMSRLISLINSRIPTRIVGPIITAQTASTREEGGLKRLAVLLANATVEPKYNYR